MKNTHVLLRSIMNKRVIMPTSDLKVRKSSYLEVNLGLKEHAMILEAQRCLQCKHQPCVQGCPVGVDIPGFIEQLKQHQVDKALEIITKDNPLPSVCGRVCPQETQCEAVCVYAKANQPIAIGYLERYVGDYGNIEVENLTKTQAKIAVVGGGPAGLSCAMTLAQHAFDVTIFDTWDQLGGVLYYGIPEFRLPNEVVKKEVNRLLDAGVRFERNMIVGVSVSLDDLFNQGYQAIFLATGAGLPSMLTIENMDAIGVFSANEYLTRLNVFHANQKESITPLYQGKKVIVIGGGNVAMDAARSAIRQQADVTIAYRRTQEDMPARIEEVHHAIEEGVKIFPLLNPLRIISDPLGYVSHIEFSHNRVEGIDHKGRSKIVDDPTKSNVTLEADMIIVAVGTQPNKLLQKLKGKLEVDRYGCIVVNEQMQTSIPHVYAGGDAVLGAATVILALGQGKKAALNIIDQYKK